jgi:CheY-like chemotaxis protein
MEFRRRPADRTIVLPDPAESAPAPPALKPRLLVCDDNDSVAQLIETMFTLEGWVVDIACDGPTCLAMVGDQRPDVIVLDQQMPRMTGIDTAKELRASGYDGPAFLFSAYLTPALRKKATTLDLRSVSKVDTAALVRFVKIAHEEYVGARLA